jgi:hypothetical protein
MRTRARLATVFLGAIFVSACSGGPVLCPTNPPPTLSTKSPELELPNGCRLAGPISNGVGQLDCVNGRSGFVATQVQSLEIVR